jgi:glycosyltransferase involved in cell wall biosynthesis
MISKKSPHVLYVCTYPPRECGIAEFSNDLTAAFDKEFNPGVKSKILAMNPNGTSIYNYPKKVIFQINDTDMEDYLNRAKEINKMSHIKLVNIQHEYGLFRGEWGNYLLPFLELLNKPVVTTFHTVLPNPDKKLLKITQSIAQRSSGLVVMTKTMAHLLQEVYGVPKKKIHIIPHGVHHISYPSKSKAKRKLNLSGHTVLSTFGMLNRDKGIEYAIESLPEIIKKYPDVLYLVIGATHPVVRREQGEVYRNKLKRLVHQLNLKEHVKFYDKFLSTQELIEYLKATDIYISPTLNPMQAVSGTISYALSCACPIVATANQYAKDVVNHERGILVGFENSQEIEKALFDLLDNRKLMKDMGKSAYLYSRHMTYQNVALSYFKVYNEYAKITPRRKDKLPEINLNHIRHLTDSFGMIQFANHTKPDIHSGYCLDDNARALLALNTIYRKKSSSSLLKLLKIYFNFIEFAQKKNGKFNNFVNIYKEFTDEIESDDTYGRTIWVLGNILANDKLPEEMLSHAEKLFNKAIRWSLELKSPRAIAFTILGAANVLEQGKNEKLRDLLSELADMLVEKFKSQAGLSEGKEWLWFENCFTYSNSKMPESLFRAYKIIGNEEYLAIAKKSMDFLISITFEKNYFSPIGQNGWYFRDGKRSFFDQQPEDASSTVEALVTAYKITSKKDYLHKAKIAFEWFLGKNHLSQMIYDEITGGCYDGLGKYSLNFNQGAESTISYLLARLAIDPKYNKYK